MNGTECRRILFFSIFESRLIRNRFRQIGTKLGAKGGKVALNSVPNRIVYFTQTEVTEMKTMILCTVSSTDFNDSAIDSLVHFTLKSHLNEIKPLYAVYCPEKECIVIKTENAVMNTIKIDKKDPYQKDYSLRYLCVRSLLSELDAGDCLMVNKLSDLGEKDSEAEALYFTFHKKGICQYFYDLSYLDTEVLELPREPSVDQKVMIRRIITNYYKQMENKPVLKKKELKKLSDISAEEKKYAA